MLLITRAGCIALLLVTGILDHWMQPSGPAGIAFIDVNVVTMDRPGFLQKQTVLIQKDRIQQIGNSSEVRIPEGIQKIPGRDLFLMPGLVDMHVHLHSKADALLLLANGVTTVRNMRGTPLHLAWKDQIASGKLLAPTIYSCGPILDGIPPSGENVTILQTDSEIEESIRSQKALGFDCIKVYNRLSPAVYAKIVETAHKQNLQVAGHVPFSVGLAGAFAMHQDSIEHLTGYMKALRINPDQAVIDEEKIPELAKKTQLAGVWNCPTLVVEQKLMDVGENFDRVKKLSEMKYVPASRLEIWNPSKNARFQAMNQEDFEGARRGLKVLNQITLALHKKGARLLLGTDAPSYFVVPGFSAQAELANLVHAGLSPFEAIQTATVNPAEFLHAPGEFGSVQSGKRADLLLVKCNPLKNIDCTKQIAGVLLRGQWLPESKIQQILSDVIRSYEIPQNRFADFPDLPKEAAFYAQYEITTNDVVVGAERFALLKQDGETEIFSQQVSDPPLDAKYTLDIRSRGSDVSLHIETVRPEGPGKVDLTLANRIANLQASLPFQKDFQSTQVSLPDGNYLDGSFMAMKVLLAEALMKLRPGESGDLTMKELDFGIYMNKGFELQDTKLHVERGMDTNHLMNFTIQMEWQYQKSIAKITLDDKGIPIFYQKGGRSFRLIPESPK